jgi:hypothetical protein
VGSEEQVEALREQTVVLQSLLDESELQCDLLRGEIVTLREANTWRTAWLWNQHQLEAANTNAEIISRTLVKLVAERDHLRLTVNRLMTDLAEKHITGR